MKVKTVNNLTKSSSFARKQRGFALLEVMLAVIVILAAGLGVTRLYQSVTENSDTQKTEDAINQVASATKQILSASNDDSDTIATADVIASGLLPATIIDKNGNNIITPYGTITVASVDGGTHRQFDVTVNDLPKGPATTICRDMYKAFALSSGGASGESAIVDSTNTCTGLFGDNSSNSVILQYPREDYIGTLE